MKLYDEEVPSWMKVGARVQKSGSWPRYNLPNNTIGEVVELNHFGGELRWFRVKWEDLEEMYPNGVEHPGWHCAHGNILPVE